MKLIPVNPERDEDYGSNENIIRWIKEWIDNNNRNRTLIMTGPTGCGKTTMIRHIIKTKGLNIKSINFDKIKDTNIKIEDYLRSIYRSTDLLEILKENYKGPKKNVIIIDESESMDATKEKNLIKQIVKANYEYKIIPIILIYGTNHKKILNELNKYSDKIDMIVPSYTNIYNYINKVLKTNRVKIEEKSESDIIEDIICNTNYDYRKVNIVLESILENLDEDNKVITQEIYDEYKKTKINKDVTQDIFYTSNELLTNYKNISEGLKLFGFEKTIIPLIIQEYYSKKMHNILRDRPGEKKKITDIYKKCIKNISYGNIYDNYIYNEQRWNCTNIYGYYSTVSISYYMNKINNSRSIMRLDFPSDLNKTSTQKLNFKHIINSYRFFNISQPLNYMYIIKIVDNYLKNKKEPELIKNFMNTYKITVDNIDNLIRIDKIDISKVIESKDRTYINNLMNVNKIVKKGRRKAVRKK